MLYNRSQEHKDTIDYRVTVKGDSKASVARDFGISPRTVGRIIDSLYADADAAQCAAPQAMEPPVQKEQEATYHFTGSATQVCIVKNDGYNISVETVTKEDPRFGRVFGLLARSIETNDESLVRDAFEFISIKEMIEKAGRGTVFADLPSNTVSYTDELGTVRQMTGKVASLILNGMEEGDETFVERIIAFSDNLMQNPSEDVVLRLYDFLEASDPANEVIIDGNGMVSCYKVVTKDYKDCFTNKIDNSVGGPEVRMPRNMVDPNPLNTCSRGYHVCSASYVKIFGGSTSRVVRVLVNPKDFVAIPKEYDDAKARVCAYKVVEDVTRLFNS